MEHRLFKLQKELLIADSCISWREGGVRAPICNGADQSAAWGNPGSHFLKNTHTLTQNIESGECNNPFKCKGLKSRPRLILWMLKLLEPWLNLTLNASPLILRVFVNLLWQTWAIVYCSVLNSNNTNEVCATSQIAPYSIYKAQLYRGSGQM